MKRLEDEIKLKLKRTRNKEEWKGTEKESKST